MGGFRGIELVLNGMLTDVRADLGCRLHGSIGHTCDICHFCPRDLDVVDVIFDLGYGESFEGCNIVLISDDAHLDMEDWQVVVIFDVAVIVELVVV